MSLCKTAQPESEGNLTTWNLACSVVSNVHICIYVHVCLASPILCPVSLQTPPNSTSQTPPPLPPFLKAPGVADLESLLRAGSTASSAESIQTTLTRQGSHQGAFRRVVPQHWPKPPIIEVGSSRRKRSTGAMQAASTCFSGREGKREGPASVGNEAPCFRANGLPWTSP